jgi:hypothetical protein
VQCAVKHKVPPLRSLRVAPVGMTEIFCAARSQELEARN